MAKYVAARDAADPKAIESAETAAEDDAGDAGGAEHVAEVSGSAGVEGSGPNASTRANAYSVKDKGDRVILNGRVRTRLEPRR